MSAVAAGDRAAQAELLERVAPRVRKVALLLARTSDDADDAAQQSLLEILRSAAGFRAPANLGAWTDRIAARTTLHLRRRDVSRAGLLLRWLPPGTQPWGGSSYVPAGQDAVAFSSLFGRLSHERREVIVLRHVLGYSPEEIAELLALPLGTVKDRLSAARRQLRIVLERDRKKVERGGGK